MRPKPRILIADDYLPFVTALRRFLGHTCEIVGAVHDGGALVAEATRLAPDIVILDVHMPTACGLVACRDLTTALPRVKCIVMIGAVDDRLAERALAAGAFACVCKQTPPDLLLATILAAFADRDRQPGRTFGQ